VPAPLHIELARTAEDAARRLGAQLVLDIDRHVMVPAPWEDALQRILREAVTTAVRHGGARTITVHLHDAEGVCLRISDDGAGVDRAGPQPSADVALAFIRERTESLGGTFKLSSAPGSGTTIEVLLP
jgi:signal transduction histidine kinase